VVHRRTWPCAKPTELKTFVHQDFHGIHLGTFGGQSNHHISKTTNFNFSQNSPPSHLPMPWCTDQFGHVQNPSNSKLSCTKTFMVFIWGHLEANQTSHLKNHEFEFFTKLSTRPSSYAVVHRPTWPCAKPSELKTFVHQDFHGIHLGVFGGQSKPDISKTTNFIFSQNSPPSHLPMPWCTANLGHVQKSTEVKTFVHQVFHGIHLGHLETFPTLTSQKSRISFFHKTPHQAI